MKILVVEDEYKIANSIKKGLEQEAYTVDTAFDGELGYDLAHSEPYDVIILDLMLPKLDGVTLTKNLRAEGVHTPVLMLTAKTSVENKVEGLNTGADDYLTKPFAFSELVARVKALSRRSKKAKSEKLKVGDLVLDTTSFEVVRAGKKIKLSKKEYSLLEYLMRHKKNILSKEQIIQGVWSYESDVLPNTVEVYIGYLRHKIEGPFPKKPKLIHTVRGFGYKLEEVK